MRTVIRVLLAISIVAISAPSKADEPSAYKCTGGSPDPPRGCHCPHGTKSQLNDANEADCVRLAERRVPSSAAPPNRDAPAAQPESPSDHPIAIDLGGIGGDITAQRFDQVITVAREAALSDRLAIAHRLLEISCERALPVLDLPVSDLLRDSDPESAHQLDQLAKECRNARPESAANDVTQAGEPSAIMPGPEAGAPVRRSPDIAAVAEHGSSSSSPSKLWMYFAAASAASGGGAAAFELWARRLLSQSKAQPVRTEQVALWHDANTKRYIGEGFGIAAIGMCGATLWQYLRRNNGSTGRLATTAPIVAYIAGDIAGILVLGQFR
jgi:hypothetical protein